MSLFSRYPGVRVLQSKNGEVPVSVLEGKTVLVYFSAHWCPPCRAFTPQLATFYKKFAKDKNFEIVFASWDSDKTEFEQYYAEHPWLALPYETSKEIVDRLGQTFQIKSIPTLLVFGADGQLITREGRMSVVRDPSAANFPWAGADAQAGSVNSPNRLQLIVIAGLLLYIVYTYFLRAA